MTVILTLATSLALHCLTLTRSPTVWQDEVQIVDCGRCLANPSTEWSVTLDRQGRPALFSRPLYVTIQQIWLRATGTSIFSVRFLSSLSAAGAVLVFWELLRSQGVTRWQSTVIALAVWFDPLFVRSFRGGRADAFALMFCFAACWAWGTALQRDSIRSSLLAGGCAALAALSWATAPVTLVLGVFLYFERVWRQRRLFVRCVAFALIAFTFVFAIHLAYFYQLLERMYLTSITSRLAPQDLTNIVSTVVGTYRRSPWVIMWLLLAIGISLWKKRDLGLSLTVVAGFAIALCVPPFYSWRLLYVVPLFYLFMARVLSSLRFSQLLAMFLLVPSMLVNLGARTGVTVSEWERRDYDRFAAELTDLIPPYAVVFGKWSHYYVGLRENWQMFPIVKPDRIPQSPHLFYLVLGRGRELPEWTKEYQCEYLGVAKATGAKTTSESAASYEAHVYRCERERQLPPTLRAGSGIDGNGA